MHRSSAATILPFKVEQTSNASSPIAVDTHPLPSPLPLTFPHATSRSCNRSSNDTDPPRIVDPFDAPTSDDDDMRDILDVLNTEDLHSSTTGGAAHGHGHALSHGHGKRKTKSSASSSSSSASTTATASAVEDAAEKRRKHREAMVLFRLRKKMNFSEMRQKEHTLQDVLQIKLQQYHQLARERSQNGYDTRREHVDGAMRELLDEFADVLTVKEALLRENRAMEGVIAELSKFQKLIQDEVERQAEEDQQAAATAAMDLQSASGNSSPSKESSLPTGEWVQLLESDPPFYYERLTQEAGELLVHDSFQRSMQLRHGFTSGQFQSTDTFCLGWNAQHSLIVTPDNRQLLRFRFTRQVPRWFMSFDDFLKLSWPVVTIPELNQRLYSTPVHMKVLQWLNKDSYVTVRNSPHRDRSIHLRYFAFNARLDYRDDQNRRAHMIHHTIMDRGSPPRTQSSGASQPSLIWIKHGVQNMNFTEMPELDCVEIEHAGYMQCLNEEQARYLMIEATSILMRWEQFVVPPRMLTVD